MRSSVISSSLSRASECTSESHRVTSSRTGSACCACWTSTGWMRSCLSPLAHLARDSVGDWAEGFAREGLVVAKVGPAAPRPGSRVLRNILQPTCTYYLSCRGLLGLGLGENRLTQQAQDMAEARCMARGARGQVLQPHISDGCWACHGCRRRLLVGAGAAAVSMLEMCETLGLLRTIGRRFASKCVVPLLVLRFKAPTFQL